MSSRRATFHVGLSFMRITSELRGSLRVASIVTAVTRPDSPPAAGVARSTSVCVADAAITALGGTAVRQALACPCLSREDGLRIEFAACAIVHTARRRQSLDVGALSVARDDVLRRAT